MLGVLGFDRLSRSAARGNGSDEEDEALLDLRQAASDDDDVSSEDSESDEDDSDEEGQAPGPDARVARRTTAAIGSRVDGGGQDDSDDSDDEDSDEALAMGRQVRDSTLTTAWGADRAAYYEGGEGDDDDDAAEEEEEAAVAMMRARAAEMDEEDFAAPSGAASAARLSRLAASSSSSSAGASVVKRDTGALTQAERTALLDADAPELRQLLSDLADQASGLKQSLAAARAAQAASRPADGVPLLEARLQLLLLYMAHVSFFLLLRAEGASARSHPVVRRLVRLRGLLERSRPLVARMRPRIDRAVRAAQRKAAGEGGAAARDEDLAAPALGDLDADDAAASSASSSSASGAAAGKFRPSKLAAVPYTGDDTRSSKEERAAERRRVRASRSSALAEMRAGTSDRPEEHDMAGVEVSGLDGPLMGDDDEPRSDDDDAALRVSAADDGGSRTDRALAAREEERRRFEEENFVRLGVSRSEKKARNRRERERQRFTALGDIGGAVDDIAATLRDEAAAPLAAPGSSASVLQARQQAGMERFAKEVRGAAVRAGKRSRADEEDDVIGGGEDLGGDGEDDLYAAAARKAAERRSGRRKERESRFEDRAAAARASVVAEPGAQSSKREITREIRTNRGLTKYRKKEDRNPRVANRRKAEQQAKRRKSAVPDARREDDAGYGGEATGVRGNITRSRIIR